MGSRHGVVNDHFFACTRGVCDPYMDTVDLWNSCRGEHFLQRSNSNESSEFIGDGETVRYIIQRFGISTSILPIPYAIVRQGYVECERLAFDIRTVTWVNMCKRLASFYGLAVSRKTKDLLKESSSNLEWLGSLPLKRLSLSWKKPAPRSETNKENDSFAFFKIIDEYINMARLRVLKVLPKGSFLSWIWKELWALGIRNWCYWMGFFLGIVSNRTVLIQYRKINDCTHSGGRAVLGVTYQGIQLCNKSMMCYAWTPCPRKL